MSLEQRFFYTCKRSDFYKLLQKFMKFQPHFAPPQKNLDIYEVRIIIQFRYN